MFKERENRLTSTNKKTPIRDRIASRVEQAVDQVRAKRDSLVDSAVVFAHTSLVVGAVTKNMLLHSDVPGQEPEHREKKEVSDIEKAMQFAEIIQGHEVTTRYATGTYPFISARKGAPRTEIQFEENSYENHPPTFRIGIQFEKHNGHMQAIGGMRIREDEGGQVRESGDLSLLFGREEDPSNPPPYIYQGSGLERELEWIAADEFRTSAGHDIMGEFEVVAALKKTQEGMGDAWPQEFVLPEESEELGSTSTSTLDTFKALTRTLSAKNIVIHTSWDEDNISYSLSTHTSTENPSKVVIRKTIKTLTDDGVILNESEGLEMEDGNAPILSQHKNYDTISLLRVRDQEVRARLEAENELYYEDIKSLIDNGGSVADASAVARFLALLETKVRDIQTERQAMRILFQPGSLEAENEGIDWNGDTDPDQDGPPRTL